MLQLLIDDERQARESTNSNRECFEFVLNTRPIDLLADICLTDSPPGASVCILNWMRRFLSCLKRPRLDHKSILQPVKKLIGYCSSSAGCASPYEQEEIVFLLTVAGVIRKEPLLVHLFLPTHEHTLPIATLNPSLGMKTPAKNTLFENAKIDSNLRRISLVRNESCDADNDAKQLNDDVISQVTISCECKDTDFFILFDSIVRYFDSAVSLFCRLAVEKHSINV